MHSVPNNSDRFQRTTEILSESNTYDENKSQSIRFKKMTNLYLIRLIRRQ